MPKVTVLIPVFNRERYIRDAIDSVLAQSFTDFEVLAIDDGSTDGSIELVTTYADPRVRLIRNERNLGIPTTRNRGIAAARGEYLAFLDSDDIALPKRLARQVAFLDAHPDYAAVGAWIQWMDTAGRRQRGVKRKPVSAEQIAANRLFRQGIENSTAMARTSVLREFGHREEMALGSDYDLWSRIAAKHKLATLPEVLVYRRRHGERVTNSDEDRSKAWRLQIYARQLQDLGISFSQQDLERHYLLRRMHKTDLAPDTDFLDWTETWLSGLQAANNARNLYPEPAFSTVLGEFWLKTFWYARTKTGRRPWLRFWRSSLRSVAWAGIRQQLRMQIFCRHGMR